MIDYVENIAKSGLSIYDKIDITDKNLYIPNLELEKILNKGMQGLSLKNLALRTRSKTVKSKICTVLGYKIPKSFSKTHPRFPGQNFDTYTQKSLNVQIWNEEIELSRRYVFIRINDEDIVVKVKVITGAELVKLDTTGTLTKKYQATMKSQNESKLFSSSDSENIVNWLSTNVAEQESLSWINPNSLPKQSQFLTIKDIYQKLLPIIGNTIDYIDATQERNRGAIIHKMICKKLGYSSYEDNGNYPDLTNQLLEIKLQTSPTIDLGLHSPEDNSVVVETPDCFLRSEDIRYAIFDGEVIKDKIFLKALYIVNGCDFTKNFPLFKGKIQNAKLQLLLPTDFFN